MDKTRVAYCPLCGEAVEVADGVNTFYVDCSYCGTEFDAARQPYPTQDDWDRFTRRAHDDNASSYRQLKKHQRKLDSIITTRKAFPPHMRQAVGLIDVCPNCGGSMIGDGITLTRHCEYADLPEDSEPDAPALYCEYDDENNKR